MISADNFTRKYFLKSPVLLGTFLFFLSCSDDQKKANPDPAKEQDTSYTEIYGEAQGTTYRVVYNGSGITKLQIDSLLTDFDNSLSTYNPASLISHFNAYGEMDMDENFTNVFRLSKQMHELAGGAFNPAIYPIIDLWGFGQSDLDTSILGSIDSVLLHCKLEDIIWDSVKHTLTASNNNRIEFNAIAQGYSVDLVSEFLKAHGIVDFLVEVGGEIYVSGVSSKGFMWRLGIEKPNELKTGELKLKINLTDRALATSGNYRKFKIIGDKKYSHTIDPFTGKPVEHSLLSASVIASSAGIADALATAFMVMGVDKTKQFIADHPELEIDVFLIYDEDGQDKTWQSSGIEDMTDQAA